MSTSNVQIVISAQDRASEVVKGVEEKLEGLGTKARRFGGQIVSGVFASQTTIMEAARVFDKNLNSAFAPILAGVFLAGDLAMPFGDAIKSGLDKVAANPAVMRASALVGGAIGAVQAGAHTVAATGSAAISSMAAKIGAMSIPLAASGTTVGTAVGGAMGAAIPLAMAGGLAAAGTGALFSQAIIERMMGADATSKIAGLGATVADVFAAGYSAQARATYAEKFNEAWAAAMAGGATHEAAALAGKAAADAFLAGVDPTGLGARIDGDLATSLQNNTNVIDTAMEKVAWAIAHPLELAAQQANLAGAITTLEFQRGLASNTPMINDVLDQQIAVLKGQWATISGKAWEAGGDAARAWTKAYLAAIAQARRIAGLVTNNPGSRRGGADRFADGRAAGGPVNAGETYVVGERGPELLHMGNRSGNVQANAGGHGHDIYLDGEKVGRTIDRRNGRQMALAPSSNYSR